MQRWIELLKISSAKFLKFLFVFCIILLVLVIFTVFVSNYVIVKKYTNKVEFYSNSYEIDKNLVLAIIKVESNFNKDAKSDKGAYGLMQLKISTFDFIKEKEKLSYEPDIFNESDNIMLGCAYLRYLFTKFNTLKLVLCAYNAGEGNVTKWLSNKNYSKDGKNLDKIPFNETRNYYNKVIFYYNLYKKVVR